MSMTNDTEAAHETVSEAWRTMIGLRMIEDREGKVLSGQNVAHLKTVQAALATAHVHIGMRSATSPHCSTAPTRTTTPPCMSGSTDGPH